MSSVCIFGGSRYFVHLLRNCFLLLAGGTVPRSSSVPVEIFAVGDSRPQFIQKTYSVSVEEELAPPVEVIQVRTTLFYLYIGQGSSEKILIL